MAIAPLIALSLALDSPEARWHWLDARLGSRLAVAYLGWVATVWRYSLWTGLLQRYRASRVAPFSLGVPVVGLAAGAGLCWVKPSRPGIALVVAALVSVMPGRALYGGELPAPLRFLLLLDSYLMAT